MQNFINMAAVLKILFQVRRVPLMWCHTSFVLVSYVDIYFLDSYYWNVFSKMTSCTTYTTHCMFYTNCKMYANQRVHYFHSLCFRYIIATTNLAVFVRFEKEYQNSAIYTDTELQFYCFSHFNGKEIQLLLVFIFISLPWQVALQTSLILTQ